MGLFDDTLLLYGGTFYRQFSQAHGSPDLEHYFGDESVAAMGICAGSCLDWIEHYLTTRNQRYSNAIMSSHRQKIVTIQRALRVRDQSLLELLVLYGMDAGPNGLLHYDGFNPRAFGIQPGGRPRDDAHHTVGFRQRGLQDNL
ncbi:hypothetical protein ATI61_104681 [Archangium gephyra]|uniref:Uncharacterized protein n=2 Tax=Archangium gephyra TaxID=48 RepID=A0AAC8Q2R0_9BACT|nr:Hypothetical protein AA314_01524 [Archangium gephyra]REG33390.1 hypothetical protein ATI61_104681 [Archangium gephyra]